MDKKPGTDSGKPGRLGGGTPRPAPTPQRPARPGAPGKPPTPKSPAKPGRPGAPTPAGARPGGPKGNPGRPGAPTPKPGVKGAAGSKAGLGGVKDLAKNTSDGSTGGDAKQVGKNAATGAKIGSKIGGGPVGAAVGGAAGAGIGLAKSKKGKWLLVGALLAPILPMLLTFLLIISVLGSSTSIRAAELGGQYEAATMSGVPIEDAEELESIASEYNVPWLILAANEFVANQRGDLAGEGVQSIDKKVWLERYDHYSKAEPAFTILDANDDNASRRFMAWALARELEGQPTEQYPLDAGADHVAAVGDGKPTRQIISDDESSAGPAKKAEKIYKTATEGLPIAGGKEAADSVYDIAHMWALGEPICSLDAASIYVGGEWTSPLESSGSSGYGPRIHPVTGAAGFHTGSDLPAPEGTVMYAASGGIVKLHPDWGAFGNSIVIDHGSGYETQYSHIVPGGFLVTDGVQVEPGTAIAKVGNTGSSTGAHLHFETHVPSTYPGAFSHFGYYTVDPVDFMRDRGIKLGSKPGTTDGEDTTVGEGEDGTEEQQADNETGRDSFTADATVDGQTVSVTLKKDQLAVASQIRSAISGTGAPDSAAVIAFMTAMVESNMQNLSYGDRDSLGVFQQRAGWGSEANRRDVDYSTRAFIGGPKGPNKGSPRGLLDIDGWEDMPLGDAAQAVQVSGFPDRYAGYETFARALLDFVGGTTSSGGGCVSGAGGGQVRILTYNVCSEHCPGLDNFGTRVKRIVAKVQSLSPDLVNFQELGRESVETDQMDKAMAPLYKRAKDGGQNARWIYYKVGVFSTKDITGKTLPAKGLTLQARSGSWTRYGGYQVLRHTGDNRIIIDLNLHTTPGEGTTNDQDREREVQIGLDAIKDVQDEFPDALTLIGGDLNSYGPATPRSDSVRVDDLLTGKGYVDAFEIAAKKKNGRYNTANQLNSQSSSFKTGKHIDHWYLPVGASVSQWALEFSTARSPSRAMDSDHNLVWVDMFLNIDGVDPSAELPED